MGLLNDPKEYFLLTLVRCLLEFVVVAKEFRKCSVFTIYNFIFSVETVTLKEIPSNFWFQCKAFFMVANSINLPVYEKNLPQTHNFSGNSYLLFRLCINHEPYEFKHVNLPR